MSYKVSKSTIILSLSTLLFACGGGSSGSTKTASNAYDGTWASSPKCLDNSYTNSTESVEASIEINANKASLAVDEYLNTNDCSGTKINYISDLTLSYGDDVPNASSICSNAKKVNVTVTGVSVDGTKLSAAQLAVAIAADEVPSLDDYGLICTSSDGSRIYFGDDELGAKLGDKDSNRPTQIDSSFFLLRQ